MCQLPTTPFQLAHISDQMLSILKNEEIIAINQDPVVGTAPSPFRWGINVRLPFRLYCQLSLT